jgi:hypothetical protein
VRYIGLLRIAGMPGATAVVYLDSPLLTSTLKSFFDRFA